MERADRIHNLPVPERFLPLMTRTLAEAYAAEGTAESPGGSPPAPLSAQAGSPWEWTKEEVMRAYREATSPQRAAFDYLADHADEEVRALDLARVVYPNDYDVEALNKLYGTFGGFGTKAANKYGKRKWFFSAIRERMPNGSLGPMVYVMPAREAAWLREASGRE